MEDLSLEVAAIIGAMAWTALSLLKHLRAGQYGDALTLVVGVGIGVAATFLVQAAGMALDGANAARVVVVGYGATSIIRIPYELKKAFDQNDSAKEPKLFENPPAR